MRLIVVKQYYIKRSVSSFDVDDSFNKRKKDHPFHRLSISKRSQWHEDSKNGHSIKLTSESSSLSENIYQTDKAASKPISTLKNPISICVKIIGERLQCSHTSTIHIAVIHGSSPAPAAEIFECCTLYRDT